MASPRIPAALAAALAITAFPPPAPAQPIHRGGETIVTATRLPQPPGEALRNVTVITAEDIARAGETTLAQLLQLHAGLEVASGGGHGAAASVFMRGANAAHTLVLVDGVRLQSATVGTTAFENLPLAQVERIEIVPGPVSSLYGADAIGGVIHIFTRGARGAPRGHATASIGSHDTAALRAAASAAWGGTEGAVSLGAFRTAGFNATRPGVSFGRFHPDRDGHRNANFSARLTRRIGSAHELGASAFVSDGRTDFDNGPDAAHRTDQTLAVYSLHGRSRLTPAWESLLRLGASRDDNVSTGDPFQGAFRTDQRQATWQNTFTLGEAVAAVAGVEHLEQAVEASTPFAVKRRTIASAFAGINAERGAHALQASVRHDDNSQFGSPTTGSVAYGYRLAPALRLRAAWGSAFHAPSFNDLYFPGFGNAGLAPERSRNRELGLDWEPAGQRFAATLFDNRISGLVVFVFDPVTFEGRPENVARARIRGAELSWRGALGQTRLAARLTLQQPQSRPGGLQLQRRARRHGSLVATRAAGAWELGAELVASGARFDSATEDPASRLAGYAVLNLTASRRLAAHWDLDLRWNNVAGKDYELVQGFTTPGSSVLLSLRWSPE